MKSGSVRKTKPLDIRFDKRMRGSTLYSRFIGTRGKISIPIKAPKVGAGTSIIGDSGMIRGHVVVQHIVTHHATCHSCLPSAGVGWFLWRNLNARGPGCQWAKRNTLVIKSAEFLSHFDIKGLERAISAPLYAKHPLRGYGFCESSQWTLHREKQYNML